MTRTTTNGLIGGGVLAVVALLELSRPKAVRSVPQPAPPASTAPADPADPDADPTRPCYPDCRSETEATRAERAAYLARWLRKTDRERASAQAAIEQGTQIETLERVGADRKTKCAHARMEADAWLAAAEDNRYRVAARRAAEWCS